MISYQKGRHWSSLWGLWGGIRCCFWGVPGSMSQESAGGCFRHFSHTFGSAETHPFSLHAHLFPMLEHKQSQKPVLQWVSVLPRREGFKGLQSHGPTALNSTMPVLPMSVQWSSIKWAFRSLQGAQSNANTLSHLVGDRDAQGKAVEGLC